MLLFSHHIRIISGINLIGRQILAENREVPVVMLLDSIPYLVVFLLLGGAGYLAFKLRNLQTELRAVRLELSRCQLTLEISEDVGRFGSWHLDAKTNWVKWSDYVFDMHERRHSLGHPTLENALHYYHPDDRATVETAVTRALEEGEDFEFRARILTDNEKELPVLARGTCQIGGDGDVLGIFGCVVDLSKPEDRKFG